LFQHYLNITYIILNNIKGKPVVDERCQWFTGTDLPPEGFTEKTISLTLIANTESPRNSGNKPEDKPTPPVENRQGDVSANGVQVITADETADTSLNPATFTKVEKSLISLGFFTPSSRRIKDQKVKRINFTRTIDGKRMEATAEFHPSAVLGLPVTSDQDKYLALHDIITGLLQTHGRIKNPIRFTSANLLRILNKRVRTGKNYKDVSEWLDVMTATMIISDGVVYEAGKKKFARDRFHVFERAISVGKELPDGTIADANYVWLSDWQLENINQNFLLPIDLPTYRQLKNHIAKALVPLLQVWLFASQRQGSFEKRYDELCEILSLQTYTAPSQITRQFKPSLDELTTLGYLKEWRIEKTNNKNAFKFILFHGPKFHRDRRRRIEQKNFSEPPVVIAHSHSPEPDLPEPGRIGNAGLPALKPSAPHTGKNRARLKEAAREFFPAAAAEIQTPPAILDQLVARGLIASAGMNLLNALSPERLEKVQDYIEYWDSVKATGNVGPGFLYELIKTGGPLPSGFQTSRQRAAGKTAEERSYRMMMAQQSVKFAYDRYADEILDRHIAEELPREQYLRLLQAHKQEMLKQGSFFQRYQDKPGFEDIVQSSVRAEIRQQISILSFEEFCRNEAPRILADYGFTRETGLPVTSDLLPRP
jgi:hypothetical protein